LVAFVLNHSPYRDVQNVDATWEATPPLQLRGHGRNSQ
jgi:hypothetical protein